MLNSYIIDYSIAKNIGVDVLSEYNIFPIQTQELFTLIASSDIDDSSFLTTLFKTPIKFIQIPKQYIDLQIKYFDTRYEIFSFGLQALNNSSQNNKNNSYISSMLDKIIEFAITLNASDIHIESSKKSVVIRFRCDGIMHLIFTFQQEFYPLFSSIIKLYANLDISQTRLPQNGRFSKYFYNDSYDFRVSTIPTIMGESIVIRILDNKNSKITLKDIGFNNHTFNTLDKLIKLNQGMILVTGPTGSGKTTTLYSILNSLNTPSKKIITIEDPIEYNLTGIQQININEDINLNYTTALKSILRQDPDIIMVGEIRDEKALKIAIQASLTGHLVLATLHTNNAPETINRLLDLNAEPFLIASVLKAVISQRLVRKLCIHCKTDINKPKGCVKCNSTGYDDRTLISELLTCDEKISEYISKKASINDLTKYAKTKGYITLEEHGLDKVKSGITSYEEFYSKVTI